MKFSLQNVKNLSNLIQQLTVGLTRLDLVDNFDAFSVNVQIPANSTISIRNQLTTVPNSRIILRQDVDAVISDSSTEWTDDFVYLTNNHPTNVVNLKVLFLR